MNAEALSGTVLGTCTLQRLIGRGGMGAVFQAQQSRPKRRVAVKVLLPMVVQQPNQRAAFLERFRRETDAAASLEHPNIMPVHEYGERDGLAYLVMPYISGGTLRDELEREEKLPLNKVVNYLDQMAAALDFAHERGVIHRDIKPANILMTPEKRLLLTDFGLVKIVSGGQDALNRLSETGMPMGTPDYMAPEQVIGNEIDARADIYSLGVVLYQMVTGTVPFKGEMPMRVALQHVHTPPPPPRQMRPELPVAAEQVILRVLAKRPEDRYLHARDLASAFRLTLEAAGALVGEMQSITAAPDASATRVRGLFDPVWRDTASPGQQVGNIVEQTRMTLPSFSGLLSASAPDQSSLAYPRGMNTPHHTPLPATPNATAHPGVSTSVNNNTHNTPLPTTHTTDTHASSFEAAPVAQPPQPRPPLGHKTSLRGVKQGTATRSLNPAAEYNAAPSAPPTTHTGNAGLSGARQGPLADPQANESTAAFKIANPYQTNQTGTLNGTAIPATPTGTLNSTITPTGTFYTFTPNTGSTGNGADPTQSPTGTLSGFGAQPGATGTLSGFVAQPGVTGALPGPGMQPGATGALMIPSGESTGQTGMLKLTQPVKVIKVPVAGQPGQYVTGLLPVLPPTPLLEGPAPTATETTVKEKFRKNMRVLVLVAAVLVILFGSGIILLTRQPANPITQSVKQIVLSAANVKATANARGSATAVAKANATAAANIILTDPLEENALNWHLSNGPQSFVFKDKAYHISTSDGNLAYAILPNDIVPQKFGYTLTMQEVKGDDTSDVNLFGMIFRYNVGQKNGKNNITFYSFQVLNKKDGEYRFLKFDDSNTDNPWTLIWHKGFGDEYHVGQGQNNKNTVKITAGGDNGDNFTFTVNGKQIDTAQDGSLKNGRIGMLVNQSGTEVAFSRLIVSHN